MTIILENTFTLVFKFYLKIYKNTKYILLLRKSENIIKLKTSNYFDLYMSKFDCIVGLYLICIN